MISRLRSLRDDERGATLAIVAVSITALMAMFAISFDLGLLRGARTDAQTAANAGALAGASAFQDIFPALNAVTEANTRALKAATANYVRNTVVDTPSVTVEIDHNLRQVYVKVERNNIPMWFARLIGIDYRSVEASATAHATEAGGVSCLRPLAIPDYWDETSSADDGDNIWEYNEDWVWNPGVDVYGTFGSGSLPETGFGSDFRNLTGPPSLNDYGRQVIMKPPNPSQQNAITPGWFYPIRIGDNQGGNDYRNSFTTCEQHVHFAGDSIREENGVKEGPTQQAILEVMQMDPGAYWDINSGTGAGAVVGSTWADIKDSPRTLLLAIFNPNQIPDLGGNGSIVPLGFAYYFLEGFRNDDGTLCVHNRCKNKPVVGRFLFYATGVGNGQNGQLVLQLQLIK